MKNAFQRLGLSLLLGSSLLIMMTGLAHAGPATDFISARVKEVRTLLAKSAPNARARAALDKALLTAVTPLIDFPGLSERSLGRHWAGLNKAQRSEVMALFKELVFRSYLQRVRRANESYTLSYEEEEPRSPGVYVLALSETNAMEVEIGFHMVKTGKSGNRAWIAYDLVIDEVSLTENYREQFNRIILKDGFDALLKLMRKKVEGLRD